MIGNSLKCIFLIMILNVYVGQAQTDFPYKQPDDAILGLADYKPARRFDSGIAVSECL